MKDFFVLLLKLNGVILLLLSLLVLSQIWFESFSDKDMFNKIIASYIVIIVNFAVLSTVAKNAKKAESDE